VSASSRAGESGRVRRAGAVITLVALLGLTVAVAAAPTAGAQQDGQGKLTFTLGMANDIDSMNPFLGYLAESYEVWGTIYDQLTGYSQKDFAPTPALAESWTTSSDGRTGADPDRRAARPDPGPRGAAASTPAARPWPRARPPRRASTTAAAPSPCPSCTAWPSITVLAS
jgi:hypothetical protein